MIGLHAHTQSADARRHSSMMSAFLFSRSRQRFDSDNRNWAAEFNNEKLMGSITDGGSTY